jgi:hypothetical protein
MVVRVGGDEEHAFQGKRAIAERDILGKPRTRGQRRRGNSKAEGWSVFRSPTTPGRHLRREPRRHDPPSESRSCYTCVLASSTARGLLLKDLKAGGSMRHTSDHHGLLLELWRRVPRHGDREVNSFKGAGRKI